MNSETSIDVDVKMGIKSGKVTITEKTTTTLEWWDLFKDVSDDDSPADYRFQLIYDAGFGWNGFEIRDNLIYKVNYQSTDNRYLEERVVDVDEVIEQIEKKVHSDIGGGPGKFNPPITEGF